MVVNGELSMVNNDLVNFYLCEPMFLCAYVVKIVSSDS
jgi:hypothetical protein